MLHRTLSRFSLLVLAGALSARAATDGVFTYTVATSNYPSSYDPKNIMAIWVVNQTNAFVKTLKKRAQTRQQYLYKWLADSGGNTNIDTITGATLSTHQSHTVTWNCRNHLGALVPDGIYRMRVEYTTFNGQGPYSTNWCEFVKGPAGYTTNFPVMNARFFSMSLTWAPIVVTHDISVFSLVPEWAPPDAIAPVLIGITNKSSVAESFTVTLSNDSLYAEIGRTTVSNLAPGAAVQLTFPWNTSNLPAGFYVLRATASPVADELVTTDNALARTVELRPARYDLAITAVLAAPLIAPGAAAPVSVVLRNNGDYPATTTVDLTDATSASIIGTRTVAGLPGAAETNLIFTWNTAGYAPGYHTLLASAAPVPNELVTLNNSNTVRVALANGTVTSLVVATHSVWQYHDLGFDLSGAPWHSHGYYTGEWRSGAAPLGYGDDGEATVVSFGPDPTNKYPACYLRKEFLADCDALAATLYVRRDDGIVVYLNGAELLRDNMPSGTIAYTTLATATVSGAAETNYFRFDASLGAGITSGYNVLGAEVHQVSRDSSDLGFDAALLAVFPDVPPSHDLALNSFTLDGGVLAGDRVPAHITVRNMGNVAESPSLTVRDLSTTDVLASASLPVLPPGAWHEARVLVPSGSLAPGTYALEARLAAVPGETNTANNAATALLSLGDMNRAALTSPAPLGVLGGHAAALALSDQSLFSAHGAVLRIADISSPTAPVVQSSVLLPGVIRAVAANAAAVFAACGPAGLYCISRTNSLSPPVLSSLGTSGDACALALDGTLLYLADGPAGVRVIDVANPAAPALIGSYHTGGPAAALALSGSTLFVLDAHNGLLALDVAVPSAPVLLGALNAPAMGRALTIAGSRAYIVDGEGYFSIADVSTPAAPVALGRLSLPASAHSVAVIGSVALVCAGEAGLLVVDVSSPAAPVLAATFPADDARALAVNGVTGYLADGFSGPRVLSLAAPSAPTLLSTLPGSARVRATAAYGSFLYTAAGADGVVVYSLTNSALPVFLGSLTSALNACDLALSSNLLVIADGQFGAQFATIDATGALSVTYTYQSPDLVLARRASLCQPLLALSDGHRIELLDISDLHAPVLAAAFSTNVFLYDLALASNYLYVAAGPLGVLVLHHGGASSLTCVGAVTVSNAATTALAMHDARLYAADNSGSWSLYDLADPAAPAPILTRQLPAPATALAAAGPFLSVLDAEGSAHALDLTLRLTPVPRALFGTLTHALRLAQHGALLIAAQDAAGAALLDISAGDADMDGLPDTWEQLIIDANPADAITSIYDVQPGDDFDGDRASNYAEFIAGTSPHDAFSVFMLYSTQAPASRALVISWHSVSNKLYTLHAAPTPTGTFSLVRAGLPATPPLNTYTGTVSATHAYYLITVE